jgi:chromosome segregation ATPase
MPINKVVDKVDPEFTEARARLDSLYENIKIAEEKLRGFKDLTSDTESLNKQKDSLEKEIEALNVKVADVKKQLHRSELENTVFVSNAEAQKKNLQEEIVSLQQEQLKLSNQLSLVKKEIKDQKFFHEDLKAAHERNHTALTQANEDLQARKNSLERELENLEKETIVTRNNVQELKGQVAVFMARNQEIENEKQGLDKSIFKLNSELIKLQQEKEAQEKANKADLEKALEEKAKIDADVKKANLLLDEREKNLIVREKFTKKSIDKLHVYKTQMEEKYGERFPDLKF